MISPACNVTFGKPCFPPTLYANASVLWISHHIQSHPIPITPLPPKWKSYPLFCKRDHPMLLGVACLFYWVILCKILFFVNRKSQLYMVINAPSWILNSTKPREEYSSYNDINQMTNSLMIQSLLSFNLALQRHQPCRIFVKKLYNTQIFILFSFRYGTATNN